MTKLLIIADDFTGVLDTSIQLVTQGTPVKISTDINIDFKKYGDFPVLAVDIESRHLSALEAYRRIYYIVTRARDSGIEYFYKKTDSVLRGNVGSELAALSDAASRKSIFFVPAYPETGRQTINGMQYINGQPIHKSAFAADPFDPVTTSDICEIIQRDCAIKTQVVDPQQLDVSLLGKGQTIFVVNGADKKDISLSADRLEKCTGAKLFAGCAGFAACLSRLLALPTHHSLQAVKTEKIVMISGSLNEVTKEQIQECKNTEAWFYTLNPVQKLTESYFRTTDGSSDLEKIISGINKHPCTLIDTFDTQTNETKREAMKQSISTESMRSRIADNMGVLIDALIARCTSITWLLTGGDTLYGFIKQHPESEIIPICIVEEGVVLVHVLLGEQGGFGSKQIIEKLRKKLL